MVKGNELENKLIAALKKFEADKYFIPMVLKMVEQDHDREMILKVIEEKEDITENDISLIAIRVHEIREEEKK